MKAAPIVGGVSASLFEAGPEIGHALLPAADLPVGKSWSAEFQRDSRTFRLFLHHGPKGIYAFENSCPHAGTPLNLIGDRFLNQGGTHYICATHGARFTIDAGVCTLGPCKGDKLRALQISIDDDGWIKIA